MRDRSLERTADLGTARIRSIVGKLGPSGHDWELLTDIVGIGKSLSLTTVAESVEQQSQLNRLARLGCDVVQGYLLARPVPGAAGDAFVLGDLPAALEQMSGKRPPRNNAEAA